jgi:hypothetical protein
MLLLIHEKSGFSGHNFVPKLKYGFKIIKVFYREQLWSCGFAVEIWKWRYFDIRSSRQYRILIYYLLINYLYREWDFVDGLLSVKKDGINSMISIYLHSFNKDCFQASESYTILRNAWKTIIVCIKTARKKVWG